MAREFIQTFVDKLSDEVNNYSSDDDTMAKEFAEALTHNHRTLQQNMVKVLFNGLIKYGETAGEDGRNSQAIKACKEMTKINNYFPLI